MTRKIITRCSLITGGIVIAALLAELLLRVITPAPPFSPYLRLRPYFRMQLTNLRVRGVSPTCLFTTNKWGFRGDDPPGDFASYLTVLAVGGSTTQSMLLSDDKTWPYLLQEELRRTQGKVWVGNGGIDGHSSRGHCIFMRDVVPQVNPDLVLVLVGANDLALSLSSEARAGGTFWDDTSLHYRLFGYSRLYQYLVTWKQVHLDRVPVVNMMDADDIELQPQPLTVVPDVPADLRELLPQLPEYRENIRKMIALGRAAGVKMLFLTQPMLFSQDAKWQDVEGNYFWVSDDGTKLPASVHAEMMDIYNQELIKICGEEGVTCFDLAAAIPPTEENFYDAVHFTEAGAVRVAAAIDNFLMTNRIINQETAHER